MSAKTEKEEEKRLKVLAAKEKLKVTHPGLTYTKRAVCRADPGGTALARELANLLDRQQSILCPKPLLESTPEAVTPMAYAPGVWRHTKKLSPEDLKENRDWDDKRDDESDTERDVVESLFQWEQEFYDFGEMHEEEQVFQIALRFQGSLGPEGSYHAFLDRQKFLPEELRWALQKLSHAYLMVVDKNVKDGE